MQYKIHGTVMQILETHLMMGESLYTESGGMAWMKGDIEMKTSTRGGLMAGIGRALAGESLFIPIKEKPETQKEYPNFYKLRDEFLCFTTQ